MYITVEDPKRMKKSDYFIFAIILIILLSFIVVIYRHINTQSKFLRHMLAVLTLRLVLPLFKANME